MLRNQFFTLLYRIHGILTLDAAIVIDQHVLRYGKKAEMEKMVSTNTQKHLTLSFGSPDGRESLRSVRCACCPLFVTNDWRIICIHIHSVDIRPEAIFHQSSDVWCDFSTKLQYIAFIHINHTIYLLITRFELTSAIEKWHLNEIFCSYA